MKMNFSLLVIYEMSTVTVCSLWLITGIAFVTSFHKMTIANFSSRRIMTSTLHFQTSLGAGGGKKLSVFHWQGAIRLCVCQKIAAFLVEIQVHRFELIDQILGETCWKFDLPWTEKPEEFLNKYKKIEGWVSLTQQAAQKYSAVIKKQFETQINCWLKEEKKKEIIFQFRQVGCYHMPQIQAATKAYLNPCSLSC